MDDTEFTRTLAAMMTLERAHVCDELCELGEEEAEKTFTDEAGHTTQVIGPRATIEALTAWTTEDPDPEISHTTVRYPIRPGRAALEETRGRLGAENPGADVTVFCDGSALVIPAEMAGRLG